MKRIVLIDDDRNILTGLTMFLESEGFAVSAYTDGETALAALARTPADLVLLDIKMPRTDGHEVLKRLRRKSEVPVIFLTSKDDEVDEMTGLSLGADDYVKKPFSQRLLLARVKAVLRRSDPVENDRERRDKILIRGRLSMDPLRHACLWDDKEVNLTVTEFLILQVLVQHPGFVKTREQLMEAAYDDNYVDDRTIDSHIKRLRKKFRNVDPEFDAVETLYGVGYKYKEPA